MTFRTGGNEPQPHRQLFNAAQQPQAPARCTPRYWSMQGLGVSNLFHFFLLQSDGVNRDSIQRKPRESQEKPESPADQTEVSYHGMAFQVESSRVESGRVFSDAAQTTSNNTSK